MKKNNRSFIDHGKLIDKLYVIPPLDPELEAIIIFFKKKHNHLCQKYFNIKKKSRFQVIQVSHLDGEYSKLLTRINNILYTCPTGSPYLSSIREVSQVVEDTSYEIWKDLQNINK